LLDQGHAAGRRRRMHARSLAGLAAGLMWKTGVIWSVCQVWEGRWRR
jgi:hypothetical protein